MQGDASTSIYFSVSVNFEENVSFLMLVIDAPLLSSECTLSDCSDYIFSSHADGNSQISGSLLTLESWYPTSFETTFSKTAIAKANPEREGSQQAAYGFYEKTFCWSWLWEQKRVHCLVRCMDKIILGNSPPHTHGFKAWRTLGMIVQHGHHINR